MRVIQNDFPKTRGGGHNSDPIPWEGERIKLEKDFFNSQACNGQRRNLKKNCKLRA